MKYAKIKSLPSVVFCLLILGSATIGSAQTDNLSAVPDKRYVTDMLILTLREGPGNEYTVIRTLKSDAPVYVLEEGEAFLKIRTEEGQEGWVAKQYITTNTPKPIIITGLNKEIEQPMIVEEFEIEELSVDGICGVYQMIAEMFNFDGATQLYRPGTPVSD